jgi:glycine dehydrogenase subunit 1
VTRWAPATPDDRQSMLQALGLDSVEQLFESIPEEVRLGRALAIPAPASEAELRRELGTLAARNAHTERELSFLGAGFYAHFVPACVSWITGRSEFQTAYTPYQAEISQGTLQSIFEYQTAICELTGLDVSNASLYDCATAAAECCQLARTATGRESIVVSSAVNPQTRAVMATYAHAFGIDLTLVEARDGVTPPDAVREAAADAAAVVFQQPNFFGCLEDAPALAATAAEAEALSAVSVDPLSLGLLAPPGSYGADIAFGEGQALGNALSFGGPSFGFMAVHDRHLRRLPGRLVGETVSSAGERGWVLAFQTREQHIRREKATSNICTNQALNALAGVVYLSYLGPHGLRELGVQCLSRAQAARRRLLAIDGVEDAFDAATFKEFTVRLPRPAEEAIAACRGRGVHPGYPAGRDYAGLDDHLIVAVTETCTAADIERLGATLEEALRNG